MYQIARLESHGIICNNKTAKIRSFTKCCILLGAANHMHLKSKTHIHPYVMVCLHD